MATQTQTINLEDALLTNLLSDITRKERKALLGTSVLSITLALTGLVPTKITALGIEIAQSNQGWLFVILVLIVVYFLNTFIVYGSVDYLVWRRQHARFQKQLSDAARKRDMEARPGGGIFQ